MKTFFRSMGGRVFLVLLLGILGSAALTWWLAFGERQRTIGQIHQARLLEQAEQFVLTLDAIPAAGRPAFLATSHRFGLRARAVPDDGPGPGQQALPAQAGFTADLAAELGPDYRVAALPPVDCPLRGRRPGADREAGRTACQALAVTLQDGSRVHLVLPPPRLPGPPPRPDFLAYLGIFLLSIAVLAYAVARMTMQPLQRLARAAHGLGNDIDQPPLPEQGATEIRQAAAAFNAMQERIRQHIGQRTQMLAAITHDLQTPLTRLRLRLEKVQDPALRARLVEDLSATQAIVREGLDLARSVDSAEPSQRIDLDSLLDSVCGDAADAGQRVRLHGKAGIAVSGRPTALRRCLVNLIDNAVKYGRFAQIAVEPATVHGKPGARIRIRDGGPGIPPGQLENVFEPFFRVEGSRSRDTGGTGLGLTIARNIARLHGGHLSLENHPEGGLEAALLLPAAPATPATAKP